MALFDTLINVGIIVAFLLYVVSRFTNKSIGELVKSTSDFLNGLFYKEDDDDG